MAFYVYILESEIDGAFYKGFSEHPLLRLVQHNNGEVQSTASKRPWRIIYIEAFDNKREVLIRERNLKKATRDRIKALISHPKNIVTQFIQ